MDISIVDNNRTVELIKNDGSILRHSFNQEIEKYLLFGEVLILMFKHNKQSKHLNIDAYSVVDFKKMWTIDDPSKAFMRDESKDSVFVDILKTDSDDRFIACNWDSHDYEVDLYTGKFKRSEFTK